MSGWVSRVAGDEVAAIFAFWSGVVLHRFRRLHLAGRLVFAQADETRVTQIAVRRAFGIGDFGDEARLDPFRVPRGLSRRVRERRGLAGERPQLACDFGQTRLVEAGSDAAAVAQLPVFEFAEQQRGKRPLFLGGGPPTADDEFIASRAFRLDPPRGAPRDIGLVGPLRHDAFEPHSAGLLQDLAPVADYMVAVQDDVGSIVQQRREPLLALDQRKAGEILSIEFQEIEGVISECFSAAVERALQPPKIGAAVFVGDDHLAVDQRGARRQLRDGLGDAAKFFGPIETGAGVKFGGAARHGGQHAIAVELYLMQPFGA